jgi:hypothetical protein
MARSMDVAVTLLHQHPGQLVREDVDYADTLEGATGLQIVFNPAANRVRKWIIDTGGTATRPQVSWTQTLAGYEGEDDDFRLAHADSPVWPRPPAVSVTEREERAVRENDLIRWSANPRVALVRLIRDEGLARYGGRWLPVLMPYHVTAEEYRLRQTDHWPLGDAGTIHVPLESEFDRRFRDGGRPSAAKSKLQDRIRKLRDRK